MKTLEKIKLNITQCKNELVEFKKLLDGKSALSEQNDILPYTSQHERMIWRSERVSVAGRQVNCITFDELYGTLALKIKIFG